MDTNEKFTIPLMTGKDVLDALKDIKSHKATGIDNINARLLKVAALIIVPSVTKIMNLSLASANFPRRWKTAKVTPLFIDGERDNVTNYNPISVLPVLSKIIEKHVHKHLYRYMTQNNLIYTSQSGFHRHHSTETALI